MRSLLTFICAVWLALPVYAQTINEDVAKMNIAQDDLLKMGETLFNTEGTNTCVYCHGKGGHGGNQAGAADLRHPRTWRSYQALGGDAAFNSNKEKFLKDMETSLVFLIRNEATIWNLQFEKKHKDIKYDWSKVAIPDKADKYNNMMKGITAGPMRNRVKEIVETPRKLKFADAQDVAAVAAFTYVKTFDDGSEQGGVFK